MTLPDADGLAGRSKETLEALGQVREDLAHTPGEQSGTAGEARADQIRRRRRAARAADANLRIEGLSLSDEARALRERWIEGELTRDELIEQTKARLAKDGLLGTTDG